MRRTRKLLVVSLACVGILMALLLTAVVSTHLLANRDIVKSFIVGKTARATGGTLVYDHLDISFFPMPHLKARDIDLRRQDAFAIAAQELSVYPRLLPLLKGRISIRRFAMVTPDVRVRIGSDRLQAPAPPEAKAGGSLADGVKTIIGGLFGALAAIDPGTDLQIKQGTVTLAFTDAPDLRINNIDATVHNNGGDLSLTLQCRSDLTGNLTASANADVEAMQARGRIWLTDINARPLMVYAPLPGGITIQDTQATVNATFTVTGPKSVSSRFDLRLPSLMVMRGDRKLEMDTVAVSGTADYADKSLSLSIDTLQAARPALNLSATASLKPTESLGKSVVEVNAATGELDVAVAGTVSRAIAGDLDAIRTAFSVAKKGRLTDVSYHAGFDVNATGWHLNKMKAAGHMAQGLVTIPGIEADFERMDGDVLYEDQHVAFENVSGHFKGTAFKKLDAAIDWEKKSTLRISSPSAVVDTTPMFAWLTSFKGLEKAKAYVETATGTARVDRLEISGPLTEPAGWAFEISGTPEAIRLTSPMVPFEVLLSGGNFHYKPRQEQLTDVTVAFLDSNIVTSYQSKGIINPESADLHIDGSMGQATIDWLSTILPIPGHLQMKPPVDLAGVNIAWSSTRTLALMGGMKTAGGVDLFVDFTVYPDDWQIRQIRFTDGSSRATVTADKRGGGMAVGFSGNLEKNTVDRILESNQTLSGRLEGDFLAEIDTRSPLKSKFTGKLFGEGLRVLGLLSEPIDVRQFSIDGSGGHLKIAPSEVSLGNSLLMVDGVLDNSSGNLAVDLNVDADRIDAALIRTLQPIGKDKTDAEEKTDTTSSVALQGVVHVKTGDFTYGGFSWSQVLANIRFDADSSQVRIDQADLCGISTTGGLAFSPLGMSLRIAPTATDASLQKTVRCLWNRPVKAVAQYDLSGEISLPPTRENPDRFLSGQVDISSRNGNIEYASVLMKIFTVLNITEIFTGGKTDLAENGYGFTNAHAKAQIADGKVRFDEILLDGNSLKITGQGNISLDNLETNITLLAAPLKTIDRIVNKIPIINYISGGSLITIPLQITGPLADIKVKPIRPSAVGQGLLNIMERTLKAPFKLVQSTSDAVEAGLSKDTPPMDDSKVNGP
jgi:hypothetical protein